MADHLLVAYDGSPHGEDTLLLARQLHDLLGLKVALANVYRADPPLRWPSATVRGRERFLARESERLLERARDRVGVGAALYPLAGTTTASALQRLAEATKPVLLLFGSAYNAPPGRVHPGSAARRLLQSAAVPIGFTPAGYQKSPRPSFARVSVGPDDRFGSAAKSGQALASALGATVVPLGREADLLLIGSPQGKEGRLRLGAAQQRLLQSAEVPVVVVPHRYPVPLAPTLAAA